MRRKITAMNGDHYQKLLSYCANSNLHIYKEWIARLMFSAEVPDNLVSVLNKLDAAVNDDAGGYPVGECESLKKI